MTPDDLRIGSMIALEDTLTALMTPNDLRIGSMIALEDTLTAPDDP